jgi:hypothetical protein
VVNCGVEWELCVWILVRDCSEFVGEYVFMVLW